MWRAPAGKPSAAAAAPRLVVVADAASSAAASPAGSAGSSAASSSSASSVSGEDDLAARRARVAAAVEASMEGGWPLFLNNMVTFLWKTIYGRRVAADAYVKPERLRKLLPHLSPEELAAAAHVRHTFEALSA